MSEAPRQVEFKEALEAAIAGGPERHRAKTAEQGKMPVRERVARLVDADSFAEEAMLANWDAEGLGADGLTIVVITHDAGVAAHAGRTVAISDGILTERTGTGHG